MIVNLLKVNVLQRKQSKDFLIPDLMQLDNFIDYKNKKEREWPQQPGQQGDVPYVESEW